MEEKIGALAIEGKISRAADRFVFLGGLNR